MRIWFHHIACCFFPSSSTFVDQLAVERSTVFSGSGAQLFPCANVHSWCHSWSRALVCWGQPTADNRFRGLSHYSLQLATELHHFITRCSFQTMWIAPTSNTRTMSLHTQTRPKHYPFFDCTKDHNGGIIPYMLRFFPMAAPTVLRRRWSGLRTRIQSALLELSIGIMAGRRGSWSETSFLKTAVCTSVPWFPTRQKKAERSCGVRQCLLSLSNYADNLGNNLETMHNNSLRIGMRDLSEISAMLGFLRLWMLLENVLV